ncbi:MAG: glycosyltransferase family 2 protein [Endomicrobia bacterium]|nr:glycosyltransferase family 2 protein [Endomicrobiia bacterium]
MDVSIIIVNYNSKELLKESISSLLKYTRNVKYEIIVVDNNSTDGSAEMIEENFPQVILIKSEKNLGLFAGRNLALKHVKGRYILNSAPDILLIENSIYEMVKFMDEHPEIGMMGPQLLNSDGTIQESGARFIDLLDGLWNFLMLNGLVGLNNPVRLRHHYYPWDRTTDKECDVVSGSFYIFPKSVLEKIGYYDENFFVYCDEEDWAQRIKRLGYKVYYWTGTKVIHYHAKGGTHALGRDKADLVYFNDLLYYYKKYYGIIAYLMFKFISWFTLPMLFLFRKFKNFLLTKIFNA